MLFIVEENCEQEKEAVHCQKILLENVLKHLPFPNKPNQGLSFHIRSEKKLEKTKGQCGQGETTLGGCWEWQATEDQQEFSVN